MMKKPNWLTKLKEKIFSREKELSLDTRSSKVRHDFYERFPMPQFYDAANNSPYVVEVFDAYLIAAQGDDYYRVAYTEDGGEFEFANPDEWVDVENTWVDVPVSEKSVNESSFAIFKQADGKYRWTTISSSAYKDRDGEIASLKAQEDDIARMDASGDYGVLRWWHMGGYGPAVEGGDYTTFKAFDGADLGVCDFSAMHGKMRIETGTFYDNEVAESLKDHVGELGVSIAFSHPASQPDAAKVLSNIHTFERSLLPNEKASNLFTSIPVIEKETKMDSTKEAKLKELIGSDAASKVLGKAATTEKAADNAGVTFKEGEQPAPAPQDNPRKIGDMTEGEFTSFLGNAMKGITAGVSEKEAKTEEILSTVQASLKSAQDADEHILAELAAIKVAHKAAQEQLAELRGDLPRSQARGYQASKDPATATEKASHMAADNGVTTKSAAEQTLDSFFGYMVSGNPA